MSVRTKISVRLTQAGSNLLGGLEWAILDLTENFVLRKSKDVEGLSDINEINTEGILAFSVPFSTTNDAAFLQWNSPLVTDQKNDGIEAYAIEDGNEAPFDMIFFKEKNDQSEQWELEFRRSPNHWLELASKKKLCTIDCGQATLDATVVDTWPDQFYVDGEDPLRWIPSDYGGWVDANEPQQLTDAPVKMMWLEDLRPYISEVYLLVKGFCEIGWTLEGLILEEDWVRAQFVYILGREFYTQSKGGNHVVIGRGVSDDVNLNTDFPGLGSVQYDPGGNSIFLYPGIENTLPYKACYEFTFQGTIHNANGTDWVLKSKLMEYDESLFLLLTGLVFQEVETTLPSSTEKLYVITMTADLEPGQKCIMYLNWRDNGVSDLVNVTLKKGYTFKIKPCQKTLIRGDVVNVNRLINCDLFLLSMFKGFVNKVNGRLETDYSNRILRVHPNRTANVDGSIVPGFVLDGESPIDISEKVICKSVKQSPVKNNLSRYTRYAFAQSTDAYIQSLEVSEPPFSRKVINSIELPDKVVEITNEFYEPTMEGQNEELRTVFNFITFTRAHMVYLPRLYDNMDGEISYNIGPRCLFFYGLVKQWWGENDTPSAFYFEGSVTYEFGYGSQLPTVGFFPGSEPGLNSNLVYGRQPSDIYVKFYLGNGIVNQRGLYCDALVDVSNDDYYLWNFRIPFFMMYNGDPVLMYGLQIKDHDQNIPTPMRFLIPPSATDCCELPCSCKFSECDYYQDFGQYITQDTLDALTITSFKVNSVEKLTAPKDLGIINVVQIVGKQFVTNLVDALNDLEIDYFTFAPSTKDYALKEDLRFFKIKRPACWSFEIIISDVDGEVYKYTDSVQQQQWFDASWEGFGYTNEFTVPLDCVIATEY